MTPKNLLMVSVLALGHFFSLPVLSADMTCHLSVSGGNVVGNGTSYCFGQDFSFGGSTSGRWSIINITKSIDKIDWRKGCSAGLSCTVTVHAYTINKGEAYIHYDDGSIEFVEATMEYETGF
ncbi:hypothetical protein [Microbulbifer discodermiae]|uniref:hypothetical protein n=1 Tax=Microbulbifer sp. 2201CG32-9 TaxID=3232309 RepID=UPI00345BADBB